MRVLACPDSFKGTLSAAEVARIITCAAEALDASIECVELPLSDGGEGALGCLAKATDCELIETRVTGPLGEPVCARWARTGDGRAFIEAAEASGLALMGGELDPLRATSKGTGELIVAALRAGLRDITLALGGSAVNDGGMGALSALGVRFFDAHERALGGSGEELERVSRVDIQGLDGRLQECSLTVLCDVDNPLLGPDGATMVFGPQKGATPKVAERLEAGMERYARLCAQALGRDLSLVGGAGAAGGLGFACLAFLGAKLVSGIEGVLDLMNFDDVVGTVDLVVTGEGHADAQTAHGKVVWGVMRHAARVGVPCVALVGAMDEAATELLHRGLYALMPAVIGTSQDEALRYARRNVRLAAERLFSLIALGKELACQG